MQFRVLCCLAWSVHHPSQTSRTLLFPSTIKPHGQALNPDDMESADEGDNHEPVQPADHPEPCAKRTLKMEGEAETELKGTAGHVLSDSNTNVNSMINRRVSLFYRYPSKAFHHMVCPCTLDGVCVVCPGTSELVGQQTSAIGN